MSPRESDNPKAARMEVRLTEQDQKMLDYCAEAYRCSKGEVIRQGIELMHDKADRERELQEAYDNRQERMEAAKEEREKMVYDEAYQEAYDEAYAEEYANLIVDQSFTPSEAEAEADGIAKDRAKEAAKEAVKEFWNT